VKEEDLYKAALDGLEMGLKLSRGKPAKEVHTIFGYWTRQHAGVYRQAIKRMLREIQSEDVMKAK
jgi:hypothetical protein